MRPSRICLLAIALLGPALASWSPVWAGPLAGQITDAKTGEPIPFVNLGIAAENIGTVSDDQGRYQLEAAVPEAEVSISVPGYRPHVVTVATLQANGGAQLEPLEMVETVVVAASRARAKQVELGHRIDKRRHSVGFASGLLGTQIGARIPVKRKTYVKSAHFIVNRIAGENLLYRVNLYDLSAGQVGENLLRESVLLEAPQKVGTISVDLADHNLIVEDDVLLSLEWIRDDGNGGNSNVMFNSRRRGTANLFLRTTSGAPFIEAGSIGSAPSLGLGFYLTGLELE